MSVVLPSFFEYTLPALQHQSDRVRQSYPSLYGHAEGVPPCRRDLLVRSARRPLPAVGEAGSSGAKPAKACHSRESGNPKRSKNPCFLGSRLRGNKPRFPLTREQAWTAACAAVTHRHLHSAHMLRSSKLPIQFLAGQHDGCGPTVGAMMRVGQQLPLGQEGLDFFWPKRFARLDGRPAR